MICFMATRRKQNRTQVCKVSGGRGSGQIGQGGEGNRVWKRQRETSWIRKVGVSKARRGWDEQTRTGKVRRKEGGQGDGAGQGGGQL